MLNRASDYKPKDPIELVENHLPADVVVLAGKKGTGKSQMIAHWVACITAGKEFAPGIKPKVKGEAVIFHGERSIERTLIGRLFAAGAKLTSVFIRKPADLETAAKDLKELLAKHPKIKLVIIDPVNAFLNGKNLTNARTRQLLKPFLDLCEDYGICVVLVCHFTKGGNKDLIDMICGSGGLTQAACSIWVVAKVKDGFLLQHIECNVLDTAGQCWEYKIEPVPLVGQKRPPSRVVMLDKSPVDIQTALDLGKDLTLSNVPNCMMQIKTLLQDGQKPSAYVVKKLVALGISQATWKRAQDQAHKEGKLGYIKKGRNTDWVWVDAESESQNTEWDSAS